jgi:archaellum biogenesis ATPase FlaH
MSLVKSRKQEFLDDDRLIPIGAPTMFVGKGGEGKSSLALDFVARISNGTLEGRYLGLPRNVVLITHEDDPATQLKPRLVAAGANLDCVHMVKVSHEFEGMVAHEVPSLTRDMALIQEAIEVTAAALVVVDPLSSTIEGNLHNVQDVRRALNPLAQLAQEHNLAMICIAHTRKGQSSLSDATSGSHAFRDVARSLLMFARDNETGNRIVTVDKASYSQNQDHSFAFALDSVEVPTDDGATTEVARVRMLGRSEISVEDLWKRDSSGDAESTDARSWLRRHLEAAGGREASADVLAAAEAEGYSRRTTQRARQSVAKIVHEGYPAVIWWVLSS